MEDQPDSDEEELNEYYSKPQPRKPYQTVCLVIYVCLIILVAVMFMNRLISISAHLDERNQITTYPKDGCSSWVNEGGCVRISLYEDQCINTGNLTEGYMNTFNSTQAASLNSKLYECVSKSVTGKIIYPLSLWSETDW